MSPSGAEVLRQIKSRIDEVDPAVVREQLGNGVVVVDVRETEECVDRPHPRRQARARSPTSSRGSRASAPDRAQHVILYCAVGQPLARWAARTLIEDLGYENVESMTGGITLWKDRGYEVERPARADRRAARPLLAPPAAARGRRRGPAEAARRARCCCSAPAGSARRPRCTWRRPASARSGSSTTTSSTSRTSSAR